MMNPVSLKKLMINTSSVCNTMCMKQLVLKSKEGSSYEIEIKFVSKEDLNYLLRC